MALATLSIDIVAQLAKMQEGLDKAQRLNEKTAATIEGRWNAMHAGARALGAAIGGAFAGVSLAAFTKSTIDALDALNDAKDATGATVETLSALEDIARRNHGTLDDVTGILVKFNGALKEADGKNGVSQAIKAIGLDAADLRTLDPGEALLRVATALDRYEDSGSKARLVQDLFGKSIREAAPFLKDLAQTGRLNATVTTAQADEAERFNKQLAALKTNASNVSREFTSALLPSLNKLLEAFAKLPDKFNAKYTLGNAQITSRQLKEETDRLINLQEMATRGPEVSRGSFAKLAEEQRAKVDKLTIAAFAANQAFKDLIATTDKAPPSFNDRRDGNAKPWLRDTVDSTPTKEPTDFLGRALDDWQKHLEEWQQRNQETLDRVEESERIALLLKADVLETSRRGATQASAERAAQAIRDLNDALASTPTAQIEQLESLLAALREFAAAGGDPTKAAEAVQAVTDSLEKLKDKGDTVGSALKHSLGTALRMGLKGDFDGILFMWEEMLLEMVATGIAAEIKKRVFNEGAGATGDMGNLFKVLLGSASGNAFNADGVVPFKDGGVVSAATLFGFGNGRTGVMGEAGPEAVMPLKRGRDGKLGVAGGGGVNLGGNTFIVGDGVSEARMRVVVDTALRGQEARFMRLRNEGRW